MRAHGRPYRDEGRAAKRERLHIVGALREGDESNFERDALSVEAAKPTALTGILPKQDDTVGSGRPLVVANR